MYLSCFYKQLLKVLRKKTNKNVLKLKDENKEVTACLRRKEAAYMCKKHEHGRNEDLLTELRKRSEEERKKENIFLCHFFLFLITFFSSL